MRGGREGQLNSSDVINPKQSKRDKEITRQRKDMLSYAQDRRVYKYTPRYVGVACSSN